MPARERQTTAEPQVSNGELLERITRLERALAESAYLTHGPRGVASLSQQAPTLARVLAEYLDRTTPADDGTFVGRRETTEIDVSDEERRDGLYGAPVGWDARRVKDERMRIARELMRDGVPEADAIRRANETGIAV
jgi:hypothetical protein